MNIVDRFSALAAEKRFQGWPAVCNPTLGEIIPFFGQVCKSRLDTGGGVQDYTYILRFFGWVVVFGVVSHEDIPHVVTLVQWKPGVNRASWELPPGGLGKIDPDANMEDILARTREVYLRETGFGEGDFTYLGAGLVETGKYRGASQGDHGLPAHMYLATGLVPVPGARAPNRNEIMETLLVPLDELQAVLASGKFLEISAVLCAHLALMKLGKLTWK